MRRSNKTAAQDNIDWTCQMVLQVRRWLGKEKLLILVGDGGFATGQLALDCIRYGVTLVSRLKMNAAFSTSLLRSAGQRGRA